MVLNSRPLLKWSWCFLAMLNAIRKCLKIGSKSARKKSLIPHFPRYIFLTSHREIKPAGFLERVVILLAMHKDSNLEVKNSRNNREIWKFGMRFGLPVGRQLQFSPQYSLKTLQNFINIASNTPESFSCVHKGKLRHSMSICARLCTKWRYKMQFSVSTVSYKIYYIFIF